MPTPTPAVPNPAVAQAADSAVDSAVDDLLGGLNFGADDAAAAVETPAADDAAADDAEGDDAGEAAADDAAAAVEGEVAAAAAVEGEGDAAAAVEGEGDGAGKEDEAAAAAAAAEAAPAAPAAPAVDPAAAAREAAQAKEYSDWQGDFSSIEQKISKNEYDPIDDGPKAVAVMAKGIGFVRQAISELHREQQQFREERAAEKFWYQWGQDNPAIGAQKGQAAFQEEFNAALKKHGDPRVAAAVAEEKWSARMKVTAGVAKSKLDSAAVARPAAAAAGAGKGAAAAAAKPAAKPAGKPPTPVTPGGGRVLPAAAAATRAPATRPKSFKEKVETGAYGNFAGLVD